MYRGIVMEKVKIINYNVSDALVARTVNLGIPTFILDVVRPLEIAYYNRPIAPAIRFSDKLPLPYSHIRTFAIEGYENIVSLLHTIPVYLCKSKPKEPKDEDHIIDFLGAYYPNLKGESPYIELYLTTMEESTKGNDMHFKWLFTQVLIHELAHAALDIYNLEVNNHFPTEAQVKYSSDFGKWREESMANAVALRIIKEYGDKSFYTYTKAFMKKQDPEYALGVLMENFRDEDFLSVFMTKAMGVDVDLQDDWLKYVQDKATWTGLKNWNSRLLNNSESKYN